MNDDRFEARHDEMYVWFRTSPDDAPEERERRWHQLRETLGDYLGGIALNTSGTPFDNENYAAPLGSNNPDRIRWNRTIGVFGDVLLSLFERKGPLGGPELSGFFWSEIRACLGWHYLMALSILEDAGMIEEQGEDVWGLAVRQAPQLRPSERFAILKRDNYRCRICGANRETHSTIELEVDHITARSKGGTNDPINLWTLCLPCNRGKGNQDL